MRFALFPLVLLFLNARCDQKPGLLQTIHNTEVVHSYGVPEITFPDTVYFAGERVPIEITDVRERLDRELHVNVFWHSNTIFLLKRGNRWLPDIEDILLDQGIPADMKYIAVIESDLLNKVSPSQAVGFWQFLRKTALDYKLEVTEEVDERYHPLKSTHAAASYLKSAYNKFGNWTDAAASYNIGRRGLEQTMIRQGVTSYYDLLLPEETSRYVFRAIAVKLIFENPEKFGFQLNESNLYQKEKVKEIQVDKSITDLAKWSLSNGINYKILKRHNPWLRKNSLTVRGGKSYLFRVPESPVSTPEIDFETAVSFEEDTISETDVRELPLENLNEL